MKAIISLVLLVILAIAGSVSAQTRSNEEKNRAVHELEVMQQKIQRLHVVNVRQAGELNRLRAKLSSLRSAIREQHENESCLVDSLRMEMMTMQAGWRSFQSASHEATAAIVEARKHLLYSIIVYLGSSTLLGLVLFQFQKRTKMEKMKIEAALRETKHEIQESLVESWEKVVIRIEKGVEQTGTSESSTAPSRSDEPDHSLAIKLANEINLIERNLSLMDAGAKGIKQLHRSIEKLKDNLHANGYEMPQLLGKKFHSGMKVVVASSIPSDDLASGQEVITKVLIPQVNFKEKMIQAAQIEVSIGV